LPADLKTTRVPRINREQNLKSVFNIISIQGGPIHMRKRSLTKQVGVLFTDEAYDKLVRITDIQEIPISKFIRQIVEANLNSADNQTDGSARVGSSTTRKLPGSCVRRAGAVGRASASGSAQPIATTILGFTPT
jgi:hypothetical protein